MKITAQYRIDRRQLEFLKEHYSPTEFEEMTKREVKYELIKEATQILDEPEVLEYTDVQEMRQIIHVYTDEQFKNLTTIVKNMYEGVDKNMLVNFLKKY